MKHIFHGSLICVLLIFCPACGTVSGDKPLASKPKMVTSLPTAQDVPLPKQGELDEQGRLVLYCLKKSVISLNDEVGVMLIDENYNREDLPPQTCYILGVQSSQKFLKTFDKQVFIDALKELPPHSEIREYDKCQVSLNTTLPQKVRNNFYKIFARLGHTLLEDPDITCNCLDYEASPRKAIKTRNEN